jgi:hypothetical protein
MSIRLAYASSLLAPFLFLVACGDIAKCPTGERGCLRGLPDQGKCKFDLVVQNNRCVRPKDVTSSNASYCANWTPAEYLGYVWPGARCTFSDDWQPADGSADDLFNSVCTAFCIQDLVHAREYCEADVDVTECLIDDNTSATRANCLSIARSTAGATAAIATLTTTLEELCRATVTVDCADTLCTDGSTPACALLETDLCYDDCKVDGTPYADDGFCDDGDTLSADTGDCAYGHDCTDCGPRTVLKKNTPAPAALGESCVTNPGCAGFDAHFADSEAFCTYPTDASTGKRCLPSCTNGESCPSDMECAEVTLRTSGGPKPFSIFNNGPTPMACFPTMCE